MLENNLQQIVMHVNSADWSIKWPYQDLNLPAADRETDMLTTWPPHNTFTLNQLTISHQLYEHAVYKYSLLIDFHLTHSLKRLWQFLKSHHQSQCDTSVTVNASQYNTTVTQMQQPAINSYDLLA